MDKVKQISAAAVDIAGKLGVGEAEAFAINAKKLIIRSALGRLESIEFTEVTGLGVRVLRDGSFGHAFMTGLGLDGAKDVVIKAAANARLAEPDAANALPEPGSFMPLEGIFTEDIAGTATDTKVEALLEMEKKAVSADKRIIGAETALYEDSDEAVAIASTKGTMADYRNNGCFSYMSLMAKDNGETEAGTGFAVSRTYRGLDFNAIAKEAIAVSTGMLGAKKIKSQKVTAVLSQMVAAEFIAIAAGAASAEAIYKKRSVFVGKMGAKVAAPALSAVDDGRMPEALGSAPCDSEGVPTQHTPVITEGVLTSLLYDTKAAMRDGTKSTGNGFRFSYSSGPQISPTNFVVLPGSDSLEEILAGISNGVFIQESQGFHSGVNPISGEFSVGASGWLIENGIKTRPFREVTIAGDIISLLQGVQAISNDLRFIPMAGNIGAPALCISGLVVSGG